MMMMMTCAYTMTAHLRRPPRTHNQPALVCRAVWMRRGGLILVFLVWLSLARARHIESTTRQKHGEQRAFAFARAREGTRALRLNAPPLYSTTASTTLLEHARHSEE